MTAGRALQSRLGIVSPLAAHPGRGAGGGLEADATGGPARASGQRDSAGWKRLSPRVAAKTS